MENEACSRADGDESSASLWDMNIPPVFYVILEIARGQSEAFVRQWIAWIPVADINSEGV